MIDSRHKRFYSKKGDKKEIPPMNIKSGMIIDFNYRDKDGKPSKPLVFVVNTDEYGAKNKKVFHGLNLNHIPHTEVEKFFKAMGNKVGWELDKQSNFPKMNIYEEEDAGVRPDVVYKPIIKAKVLNRFDCWRTYKYTKVKSVKQIKWNFESNDMKKAYGDLIKKTDNKPQQPEKPKQPKIPKQSSESTDIKDVDEMFIKAVKKFDENLKK